MAFKLGDDRKQVILIPECIDDFIKENHPIRVLDFFVSKLDLKALGFKHAESKETGRPPYQPGDLLRLYIYGYLNEINSGRDLEAECHRNLEVMWLLRRLTPDFRTICLFRKDNAEPIKKAMHQFNQIWIELDLIGSDLVAIDSSKFRAVNSKDNNYTEEKLLRLIEYSKAKVADYIAQLEKHESQDSEPIPELTKEELQAKLDAVEKRLKQHQETLKNLHDNGESQISTIDPESRLMRSSTGGTAVCYQAQITVDSKNCMILDFEITNDGNDSQQLEPMAVRAKEILQSDSLRVASDAGYFNAQAIINCEAAGIETHISVPKKRSTGLFSKEDFLYDPNRDLYICPDKKELVFKGLVLEHGRRLRRYEPLDRNTCQNCPIRSQCTTRKKQNRRITRFQNEEILESALKRSKQNPELRTRRKAIVEHPFGTIKRRINHGHFLTKGKIKVAAEFALAVIAYNFKRVFSILGGNFIFTPAII